MIVITNFVAYIIPDMPRKLREQMRRETYLTNEIIMKTELEIARGEDGIISDRELASIRRRATAGLRVSDSGPRNTDSASMNNKLGWDTEEEPDGSSIGGGAYQRKGGANGTVTSEVNEESKL